MRCIDVLLFLYDIYDDNGYMVTRKSLAYKNLYPKGLPVGSSAPLLFATYF